jgi:hypothetical protein
MSGLAPRAAWGRWPQSRNFKATPYRTLLRFWALLAVCGTAGAAVLEALGPPPPAPVPERSPVPLAAEPAAEPVLAMTSGPVHEPAVAPAGLPVEAEPPASPQSLPPVASPSAPAGSASPPVATEALPAPPIPPVLEGTARPRRIQQPDPVQSAIRRLKRQQQLARDQRPHVLPDPPPASAQWRGDETLPDPPEPRVPYAREQSLLPPWLSQDWRSRAPAFLYYGYPRPGYYVR